MSRRANPMAVKAALSYEIGEAARALGMSPATIRNWIKDGLPVMSTRKPYLISGAAIREYLQAKYQDRKSPLGPDELFCPACRTGRRPLDLGVSHVMNTPKTSLLKGVCDTCGARMARMISTAKVQEFEETFTFTEGA